MNVLKQIKMKYLFILLILSVSILFVQAQNKYPVINSDSSLVMHLNYLSNWGKWGANDELGTLNYITPAKLKTAKNEIRNGNTIALARQVAMNTPGMREPKYFIQKDNLASRDYLGAIWHGFAQTHLDALCHIFADSSRMYNGISTKNIDSNGCNRLGIETIAKKSISGRGVLIDIPYLKNAVLEPGTSITIKDIENTLKKQGTQINSGDIVFIRTGAGLKNTREKRAGLHPECLFWMKQKEISILGSDGDSDVVPLTGFNRYSSAFHSVGIPWLGLPLIDNADLDTLSKECKKLSRWTFFIVIAPWKIKGATSSPINPIAIF